MNETTTDMNYANSTTIDGISTFEHTSDVSTVPSTVTEHISTSSTMTESTINSFTTTQTTGTESIINTFTTTQTMEYVHILFKEPLFLYEKFDLVVNDTITEYNVGSQLQMECNNNVVTVTGNIKIIYIANSSVIFKIIYITNISLKM
jgi:hypothetical protein